LIEPHYLASLEGYVIYLMHAASYRLAEPYCAGKRVLDLGCGSGYGTARIATTATNVQGVDVAADAVAYARENYQHDNLSFSQIDPSAPLPFRDSSFDVVLSFQVLEHVHDDHAYLHEAARVLTDSGVLILITPDRKNRLLPLQKPWNRWHLREYSARKLRALVERNFEVQHALQMHAPPELAGVELDRYRRLKWVTVPFTLPMLPESLRRAGLDCLHRIRGRLSKAAPTFNPPDVGEEVIQFVPDTPTSLNLAIIACPRPRS
jgi:SAM-dependent methyltransferase